MARNKVKLERIEHNSTRRTTLKKRRKGLFKKISELSTLCDVQACAVVYAPDEPQPEVWPNEDEARHMLTAFRALPEAEQNKKMLNQDEFLQQRIEKMQIEVGKSVKENTDLEATVMLLECISDRIVHELHKDNVASLASHIESKILAIEKRMEDLEAQPPPGEPAEAVPTMLVDVAPHNEQNPFLQAIVPVPPNYAAGTSSSGAGPSGSGAGPSGSAAGAGPSGGAQFVEPGSDPWGMGHPFFHRF